MVLSLPRRNHAAGSNRGLAAVDLSVPTLSFERSMLKLNLSQQAWELP